MGPLDLSTYAWKCWSSRLLGLDAETMEQEVHPVSPSGVFAWTLRALGCFGMPVLNLHVPSNDEIVMNKREKIEKEENKPMGTFTVVLRCVPGKSKETGTRPGQPFPSLQSGL